jgi:hypothetical protein
MNIEGPSKLFLIIYYTRTIVKERIHNDSMKLEKNFALYYMFDLAQYKDK